MKRYQSKMEVALFLADCHETTSISTLKREFALYLGCTQASCVDLLRAHKLLAAAWHRVQSESIRPTNKKQGGEFLRKAVGQVVADGIRTHKQFKSWTRDFLDCAWRFSRRELNSIRSQNEYNGRMAEMSRRFKQSYQACGFKTAEGYRSDHTLRIENHPKATKPHVASEPHFTWEKNANWKTTNSLHAFKFSLEHWNARVDSERIAVVDGMLTIWAERERVWIPEGKMYQAWYVRQGRGSRLVTEVGYIAVVAGLAAHGSTRERAHKRAVKKSQDPKLLKAKQLISEVLEKMDPARVVTFEESVSAGNCPSGTKDWAEKHLSGRKSVTVGELELVLNYTMDRLPLVLRVLRSLR